MNDTKCNHENDPVIQHLTAVPWRLDVIGAIDEGMQDHLQQLISVISETICLARGPATYSLTLKITDNDELRELNRTFRGKDKPTNILSFPDGETIEAAIYLGDLALSWPLCVAEAAAQNKPANDHFIHLVCHGILHLMGYTHDKDETAEIMEATEVMLLTQLNIANPY